MSQRMAPKQGQRERVFVLMTWLRDDNGDMVEGTDNILAGTSSDRVGREVLECFKKNQNGHVTLVHQQNEERYLPGLLGQILEGKPETAPEPTATDEGLDSLLNKVQL